MSPLGYVLIVLGLLAVIAILCAVFGGGGDDWQ